MLYNEDNLKLLNYEKKVKNMKKYELKDRLKEAMDLHDMKQADLAEKGEFDKGQLSSWLSGKYKPRQINISKLADILSVNEAWLMGYDVEMERHTSDTSNDDDIRRIQRARNNMPLEDRERMMKLLELSFQDYFKDDGLDDPD